MAVCLEVIPRVGSWLETPPVSPAPPLCCRCCLPGKYLCAKAEILDQRRSRSLLSTGGLEKFSTFCFQSYCLALVRLSHSLNSTHIRTYTVLDAFTYSCVGASFLLLGMSCFIPLSVYLNPTQFSRLSSYGTSSMESSFFFFFSSFFLISQFQCNNFSPSFTLHCVFLL